MTNAVSSALTPVSDPSDPIAAPLSEVRNRHIVRWYVMVYPTSSRAMTEELDRELTRRQRDNEPLFEYFAPILVEAKKINGRLVRTRRPLLYNYLFVHASEAEIYRIKRRLPQYNLLPRVKDSKESYYYPYLTDKAMRDLQWIARSYAEPVPICSVEPNWLVKGDRIRITEGRFAGIEAKVITNTFSRHKEILVSIDNWMYVPLLKVHPGEYEVIELNAEDLLLKFRGPVAVEPAGEHAAQRQPPDKLEVSQTYPGCLVQIHSADEGFDQNVVCAHRAQRYALF